jgi:hypothetical protein
VVRGNTCPNEPERMWVAIKYVNADTRNILKDLLCAVKAGWPTSHNGKAVLFVRFHDVLRLKALFELFIIILGHIEAKGSPD